jgi:photosystem II stability/assembly factor-like uncharacterized protein
MNKWKLLGPKVIPKSPAVNTNVKVNVTGRITAIVTAGETIYVGTAQGGIWKTINEGKHWTPTSDNAISLAIGALAMDPNSPEILYAGTGEGNFTGDSQYGLGILKTTDGGQTWELKAKGTFVNDRFFRIAVNPRNSNHIFAATRSGLYRSIDAGESWSTAIPAKAGIAATDIVINPATVIDPATDIAYAAIKGNGICKISNISEISNATNATPSWNRLDNFRPRFNFSRLALGISPSSPQRLYALMSNERNDDIDQFYHTGDGGESWTQIELPGTYIGTNGAYNLDVAVNPKNPDIVYLLATSIWKAVRGNDGKWDIRDVGSTIHADNHALAFNTWNDNIIYAGNDGGIYKSLNGGDNWDDSINKGLSITQFEFMEQDPKDEKRIIAGTQDNGTVIYEGKPEFYHSADGDGGFVCIDPNNSQNVWHTFNGLRPEFSTEGGKFQTWKSIYGRLGSDSNFYPPMTLDKTNANNIAIGGRRLYIDYSKGEGGWTEFIDLEQPGDNSRSDLISAINFVNSNLIYVGTNSGGVYRVTRSENRWTPHSIHSDSFPKRPVWDISTLRDQNKIIVVVSGFDTPHVFRGEIYPDRTTWTDISGTGTGRLPNTPVNALAIDENDESIMYIGTDVGVFCTQDDGTNWMSFSRGLPVCQVYDLRLNSSKGLLRAATHGRGMWELSNKSDPILISKPGGKLEIFWVHPDGYLYHKWQLSDSNSWFPVWKPLNLDIKFSFGTRPVIVETIHQTSIYGGEDRIWIFWTESNKLFYAYRDANKKEWIIKHQSVSTSSAPILGDPVVIEQPTQVLYPYGFQDVYVVCSSVMLLEPSSTISNQLYNAWEGGSWEIPSFQLKPFQIEGLGSEYDWSPNKRQTVVQSGTTLDQFKVDMNDKLYHRVLILDYLPSNSVTGRTNWYKLGSQIRAPREDPTQWNIALASDPAVARNGDRRLEVFIVNAVDGQLYHIWQNVGGSSASWNNFWTRLEVPSLPRETPTVARNGDGRLELFMIGMDDKLYHSWQTTKNDSTRWSSWEPLAGTSWPLSSNPIVGSNLDGRLELFIVDRDNILQHRWQTTKNDSTKWSGWEKF